MKKLLLLSLLLGLPVVFASSAVEAISIEFVPSSQFVTIGSPANVAIRITGLGNLSAPSLGTFDLDVSFNPVILGFSSATYGDPVLGDQLDLFGLGSLTVTTPGVGSVNLFELSLDLADDLNTLQTGAFTLATLGFATLAVGTSPLALSVNALGDADGNPLVATLDTGSVTVEPAQVVPEPATLLLVGAGLLMALGLGRRTTSRRL